MGRRRAGTAILVLWTLAALSCGRAEDEAATGTSRPTRSPIPTTTPTPEDGCRPADEEGLPEGATCTDATDADLDGDGAEDRVVLYARRPTPDPRERDFVEVTLRGSLSAGGAVETGLRRVHDVRSVGILGGTDADGAAGEELFVNVENGASTEVMALFTLDDDELVEVETVAGEEFRFPVFGSVQHGDGAVCRDDDGDGELELVLLSARRTDPTGTEWEWEERTYEWRGKAVELVDTRRGTVEGEDEHRPPRLDGYWDLDCGDIEAR